jgi:hypothetical protein
MAIFTSRFSNPELKSGNYTAVRISLGTPRWSVGYTISGAIKELMPVGLFGKYDNDKESFKKEYFAALDKIGAVKIRNILKQFESAGKDVVLLCFEDIRKGENDWCHRTMFAEWWQTKTGETITELVDPSVPAWMKTKKEPKKIDANSPFSQSYSEQLSLI